MKLNQGLIIGIWNMQWKLASSISGKIMVEMLNSHNPEIICVTEGHVNQLPSDWHACPAEADHGYKPLVEGRRKVILFSRNPWTEVDSIGTEALPSGRFIVATTETSIGPLRCMGVCIPWADAHVATGMKNKVRWQDHKSYLKELRVLIAQLPDSSIVAGDFNQRIPRKYNPQDTADLLRDALGDRFRIVTDGEIPIVAEQSIDHLACGPSIAAGAIHGFDKVQGTIELSDHFGLAVEIRRQLN
jgi:Endonuclease/Exonuclease/phosphatase family